MKFLSWWKTGLEKINPNQLKMNSRKLKLVITFISISFSFSQVVQASSFLFNDCEAIGKEKPELLQEYVIIKNALVADDYLKAKEAAIKMTRNFEDYVKDLKQPAAFVVALNEFSTAKDLKSQRVVFKELSQYIYESLKTLDVERTIYWQSCPMAFDGKGAKWLSLEEQVENPFMGQNMPECGSTIEEI